MLTADALNAILVKVAPVARGISGGATGIPVQNQSGSTGSAGSSQNYSFLRATGAQKPPSDARLADAAQAVAHLAAQFYSHHWSCPACREGTQTGAKLHRPCPAGAALWARYAEAAGREVAK